MGDTGSLLADSHDRLHLPGPGTLLRWTQWARVGRRSLNKPN